MTGTTLVSQMEPLLPKIASPDTSLNLALLTLTLKASRSRAVEKETGNIILSPVSKYATLF